MKAEIDRLREATARVEFLIQAVLVPGEQTSEGQLIQAVAIPWFAIVRRILSEPSTIFEVDWRKWEELIAAAYKQEGWEVILTPRSNDRGRDIIASSRERGTIRIVDQIKAYRPGRVVTAEEVRAMVGVMTLEQNVSKAFITTTSTFAPGVFRDPDIARLMPYRLELRPKDALVAWLGDLARCHDARSSLPERSIEQ
jgi:restriction system protein